MRVVVALAAFAAASLVGQGAAFAASTSDNWGGRGGGGHGGGWHHGHGGGQHDGGGTDGSSTVVIDPDPDAPYPYPGPYPDAPVPPDGPGQSGGNAALMAPPPMPVWYYCGKPAGFYPYVKTCEDDWQQMTPSPPPPGAGPPLSNDSWDYCDDAKAYYPYVASCKHHWVAMPATLPDVEMPLDRPPAIAMWFYCDVQPKGYFPYVQNCPQTWKMMPAIPPPSLPPAPKNTAAVP